MSMYRVTSSVFRSKNTVSRLAVFHEKISHTNTFADNEYIIGIVVRIITSLSRLSNLVFACLFVPARLESAMSLRKEKAVDLFVIPFHDCLELGCLRMRCPLLE